MHPDPEQLWKVARHLERCVHCNSVWVFCDLNDRRGLRRFLKDDAPGNEPEGAGSGETGCSPPPNSTREDTPRENPATTTKASNPACPRCEVDHPWRDH